MDDIAKQMKTIENEKIELETENLRLHVINEEDAAIKFRLRKEVQLLTRQLELLRLDKATNDQFLTEQAEQFRHDFRHEHRDRIAAVNCVDKLREDLIATNTRLEAANRRLRAINDRDAARNVRLTEQIELLTSQLDLLRRDGDQVQFLTQQAQQFRADFESEKRERIAAEERIKQLQQQLATTNRQVRLTNSQQMRDIAQRRAASLQYYRDQYAISHPNGPSPPNSDGEDEID